jgi:biotin carboxyl carrier protein
MSALLQVKTGGRTESIRILERSGNKFKILLGEKEYSIDIARVEKNVFSVLSDQKTYDIEVLPSRKRNTYSIKFSGHSFDVQVIDAEMRYILNRLKAAGEDDINVISCPMPGKIVKILVRPGDAVKAGQVVITVSAMKMESEYKSGKSGTVKEVMVSEGEIVEANLPLIILE